MTISAKLGGFVVSQLYSVNFDCNPLFSCTQNTVEKELILQVKKLKPEQLIQRAQKARNCLLQLLSGREESWEKDKLVPVRNMFSIYRNELKTRNLSLRKIESDLQEKLYKLDLKTGEKLNDLGVDYFKKRNVETAMGLFIISSEAGFKKASFNLAKCYYERNTKQDDIEAFQLFKKYALETGDRETFNILGTLCEGGRGTTQDPNAAFIFYKEASSTEKKPPQSCFNMGRCHEKGIGTSVNLEEALAWYLLAKQNNFSKGVDEALCRVRKQIRDRNNDVEQENVTVQEKTKPSFSLIHSLVQLGKKIVFKA